MDQWYISTTCAKHQNGLSGSTMTFCPDCKEKTEYIQCAHCTCKKFWTDRTVQAYYQHHNQITIYFCSEACKKKYLRVHKNKKCIIC